MKEKGIKKIIEKSEVTTSLDFTDRLLAEIEKDKPQEETIQFWNLRQIVCGFIIVVMGSGFLVYKLSELALSESNTVIPILWSLSLLLGLSYVLSINSYQFSRRNKNLFQ
tara:strand:- start:206 stop:535 length:330 start_codon:yes stop_codon:yes gene_type:complete